MYRTVKPLHPGEIFFNTLEATDYSMFDLLNLLNISENDLLMFFIGEFDINTDFANKIANITNNSPEFWLRLQENFDNWTE